MANELAAAPAYLSAQHAAQVESLRVAVKKRATELALLGRKAQVNRWKAHYITLADVERLDSHATGRLLRELQKPPFELLAAEQAELEPITNRLTAHLDQLSLEKLFERIKRLSEAQKSQLLAWLAGLLGR